MYQEKMSKNFPTLDQIAQAIKLAENEDSKIRDQRKLMFYLYRISQISPRLNGIINVRKTALSSFNYSLTGDEKLKEETLPRIKKIIDAILYNFINIPLYGSLALEVEYVLIESEQKMQIKKIFHPTELEKDFDNKLYLIKTNGQTVSKEQLIENNINFIFATDNQQSIGGVLRTIIYTEYMKDAAVQEWWNYNKRLKGIIQATVQDEGEKEAANNALANMMQNQYAITSDQVKFILNQLTNSSSLDSFEKFITLLNTETSIAVIGQANTSELPQNGGSRAALQILNLIRNDILFSDMQSVKKIINEQVLAYDYKINYNPNSISSPLTFDFIFDDDANLESYARIIEICIQNGIPLNKFEVYKRLGLTQPENESDVLTVTQKGMF